MDLHLESCVNQQLRFYKKPFQWIFLVARKFWESTCFVKMHTWSNYFILKIPLAKFINFITRSFIKISLMTQIIHEKPITYIWIMNIAGILRGTLNFFTIYLIIWVSPKNMKNYRYFILFYQVSRLYLLIFILIKRI